MFINKKPWVKSAILLPSALLVQSAFANTLSPDSDGYATGGQYSHEKHSSNSKLEVRNGHKDHFDNKTYLTFNLQDINFADSETATLRLFVRNLSHDTTLHITRGQGDWTDDSNWESAPLIDDSAEVLAIPLSSDQATTWVEVDITSLVKSLSGDKLTLIIENPVAENKNTVIFNSSETGKSPELIISSESTNPDDGNSDGGDSDDDNSDNGNSDNDNSDNGSSDDDNSDNGNSDNDNSDNGSSDDDNSDGGNSDNDNSSVQVTLLPDSDGYATGGNDSQENYSSKDKLEVRNGHKDNFDNKTYLTFNLQDINFGASGTATLRLFVRNLSHDTSLHIMRAQSEWTDSLNWDTAPLVDESAEVLTLPLSSDHATNWVEVDITSLVTNLTGDQLTLIIENPVPENKNTVIFNSSETSKSPELIISSASTTSDDGNSDDNGSDDDNSDNGSSDNDSSGDDSSDDGSSDGNGSDDDNSDNGSSDDDSSGDDNSDDGSSDDDGSDDDNSGGLVEGSPGETKVIGNVKSTDLGFGTLTSAPVTLPGNNLNAKEVYQLAHYIGRTDGELAADPIDTPIRSYQATCGTDTESPRMFVSVTLAGDGSANAETFGSVYEMQYNPSTQSFEKTGNNTLLPMCAESHGIAVSNNCERVAVICNTDYQASASYSIEKDLVEEHGTGWMLYEDNHDKIENFINNQSDNGLAFLMGTNYRKYGPFFDNNLNMADYLDALQNAFPDRNFDENTTFANVFGRENTSVLNKVLSQLSSIDTEALHQYVREVAYKENDQVWLLEWNNQTLSTQPKAYVVDKMHGGSHTGAQELIYTETDSRGRASYGFTTTHRVFDDYGDTHYSAGLTVINRNDWSMKLSGADNRGWYWSCGHGHVLNIRAFYNPHIEEYGAICTSDATKWVGDSHGQLGSIAIKMEGRSSMVSNGYVQHYIPANTGWVSNGGGHTVVPVDANTNLSLIVAPKMIADGAIDNYLDEMAQENGVYIPSCYSASGGGGRNCFLAYMSENNYRDENKFFSIARQGLNSGSQLDESSITRVGISTVDSDGYIYRDKEVNWIVDDGDCQISDPQLIDLKNGRYLMGYAKFQCISDGLSYHRYSIDSGSDRMLKPKAYYLMEVDVDGNVLAGPVELPNQGWGGIDEPVYLGDGKVGWTYISNPTIGNYGGGQQSTWEVMVYHSKASNE